MIKVSSKQDNKYKHTLSQAMMNSCHNDNDDDDDVVDNDDDDDDDKDGDDGNDGGDDGDGDDGAEKTPSEHIIRSLPGPCTRCTT